MFESQLSIVIYELFAVFVSEFGADVKYCNIVTFFAFINEFGADVKFCIIHALFISICLRMHHGSQIESAHQTTHPYTRVLNCIIAYMLKTTHYGSVT